MAHDDAISTRGDTLMQFSGENLDPESVSQLLDLEPFSSKKRGELLGPPRPGRGLPFARRGGISYSTHKLQSNDINDHFRYLLQAISPVASELKSLVRRYHLSWKIICFYDDPPPDLRAALDPSIVDRLDDLGIELILDDPNTITVIEET